ncbi:DUF2304 domain-containing protein [Candidatus Uhrbacteria bacterium]|nr:DUF2304 domain-containing protein [Candidatus Uhrbacteria bacterium]
MLMRLLLLIAAVVGLGWVISRFRKRQIGTAGLLAWCVLWVVVGVVAIIPDVTNRLADFLGIGRGADVVTYIAIVIILALLFRISIRLEQLDRAITTVTRELALRDHEDQGKNGSRDRFCDS